jgi:hypothetical protein
MKEFVSASQWISWLGATAVAAATLGSYAHTTFTTKQDSKDQRFEFERRLDRMENKIDLLLQREK